MGGVLETVVDPRAILNASPLEIQQGETITFDARDSDPVEGVITEYSWDFGDGETAITIAGFTSHQYLTSGKFSVTLTVTNSQGGTDSTIEFVSVNGIPQINLTIPGNVRAGDLIELDASNSSDPEGYPLSYSWDINHMEDSDGDGDSRNDVDSTESILYLPTQSSGTIVGSLTVDDNEGGLVVEQFTIEVQTRKYKVVWVENTLEWDFDEYLAQGETWETNMTPGVDGRILSYHALLELDQDMFLPPDNFSLSVNIVDNGHSRTSQTTPGNITQNETTSAEVNASDLNPEGVNEDLEADSEEQLLDYLLNQAGARFGQGEWIWTVVAQDADPDSLVPGVPDPDAGNDWTLTITITIMTPVLTEIAY